MNKIAIALLAICVLAVGAAAQKKIKPWTEWSEKDAQKMLDNSPWGQTQVETNTSEMFYTPTGRSGSGSSNNPVGGDSNANDRNAQGALNQATSANYHIRFLSAKPIRQAYARVIELKQKPPNPQLSEQLRGFVDRKFDEWVVVSVTFDSKDGRFSGPAMQAFNSANAGVLKNNTYLEVKGGKRVFLEDYKAPINDGLGAKFVFPRTVDGQPYITPESGEVRFYSEVAKNIKLNMRFKVAEMSYDGQLEY